MPDKYIFHVTVNDEPVPEENLEELRDELEELFDDLRINHFCKAIITDERIDIETLYEGPEHR